MQGMVGHLQVFVLSDWLSVNQPIEFSESAKGLRWLIPHQKLPWKHDSASVWPNYIYLTEEKLGENFSTVSENKTATYQVDSCLKNISCPQSIEIEPTPGWLDGQYNISLKKAPYGLPLDTKEYFIYFLVSIFITQALLVSAPEPLFIRTLSCRKESRYLLAMS